MAIPTITTIAPIVGLPSGRLRVKIEGTNFRVAPVPTGDEQGDWIRSVAVEFNGERSEAVLPYSDELLWVVTPPYYGDPSDLPDVVDVKVINLDDDGNPIATEEVTDAAAFTYKREDLTAQGNIQWITRNLVEHLQRNLIDNVSISADPDYSDEPGLVAVGDLPVVLILGPTVREDTWRRSQDMEDPDSDVSLGGDESARNMKPFRFVMEFRVWLMCDDKPEAINLLDLAIRFFRKRWDFQLPPSPGSSDRVGLELRVEDPWEPVDDFDNKIFRFESVLIVEGGTTDDTYGVTTTHTALEDQPVSTESGGEDEVPVLETEPIT